MIELEHISKTYPSSPEIQAVSDVSLTIHDGDRYGIVGYSGAGKSTLVRCINLMEKPTSGRVVIGGKDVTRASVKELRRMRKKIGMIFQQFNLFATRTVFENIAFSLRYSGMSRKKITEKVRQLLEYVELTEKSDAYPSQLSGGQKQRVAIARALASDPDVLLCDEATSALDPQTTASILKLLKRLNEETHITLIVITHQMQVVKELCNRVAVMESGKVVEEGDVYTVFSDPQHTVTKRFLTDGSELSPSQIRALISDMPSIADGTCRKILRLCYRRDCAMEALVSGVSREFHVDVNILSGNIEVINGDPLGRLIVSCCGSCDAVNKTMARIKEKRVELEVIDLDHSA